MVFGEKNKTSKVHFSVIIVDYKRGMHGSIGGTGGPDSAHPLKNHKPILFLSNAGSDPLRRRADDGPLLWYLESSLPSSAKKILPELDHFLKKLSGSAHAWVLLVEFETREVVFP